MIGPTARYSWRALIILVLAVWLAAPLAWAAEPQKPVFNLDQTHAFAGMGVQIWPRPTFPRVRDLVLKDLGIRWVRMSIPGQIRQNDLHSGISAADVMGLFADKENKTIAAQTRSMAADLVKLGIKVHLVVWQMPPGWRFDTRRDEQGWLHPGRYDNPAHITDDANYVAGQVLYAQNLGLPVAYVEPSDEPEGTWNTQWPPGDYDKFLVKTRAALDRAGLLSVGLEGPGTAMSRMGTPYLNSMRESGSDASLAALSVHDWDTRSGHEPFGLATSFLTAEAKLPDHLPLFVTEFTDDAPRWKHATDLQNTDYAVAVVSEGLALIAAGATGIGFWQAEDVPGFPSHGLMDEQGRVRQSELAFKSWLSLVPADATVTTAQPDQKHIIAVAFKNQKTLTIVCANVSTAAQTFQSRIAGAKPVKVLTERGYIGTGLHTGLIPGFYETALQHENLMLHLPPRSIVTVEIALQ